MASEREVRETLKSLFNKLMGRRIISKSDDKSRALIEYSCQLSVKEFEKIEEICKEPINEYTP